MAYVEFFSCCQIWNQGFLKGLGKFNQAINALLLSFYIIALPLGIYLAFWQAMGIKGLWSGMLIGLIVLNCLLLYLGWRHYSWEDIVKESMIRSQHENELLDLKLIDAVSPHTQDTP